MRARFASRRGSILEVVGFALLAYLPFLLSSPGKVSADTKQYLYLDPSRLLERAPYLWDPHIGTGTVPHQNIGFLLPMGPYYWTLAQLGVPDWIAQRLWLGSLSLAAVLGTRWLLRTLGVSRVGAIAGAVVYMLTPYQLSFTARMSVLLLPWAGLPWLVGLTARAVRRGGWRDPALFALVVLVVGATNATSLLLVGIAPILWIVLQMTGGREPARAALGAAGRIAVLSAGVSVWWAAGLRIQGAYGLPVLQLTETLRTVSASSLPSDLLRGLGNWFFYGGDRLGFSLDQTDAFSNSHLVLAASFAVPLVALCAAAAVRWRHRTYCALLVVIGTIVGVGAWPLDSPSLLGRVYKAFASGSSLGLALRNTARVGPVIVLGLAGLVAAGVSALTARHLEKVGAIAVVALVAIAFVPVWRDGYLSERLLRAEDVPSYWVRAASALDRAGDSTRVLEIPGINFAAYRWGNTVDPITPGLIDRPWVAREVLPYGTPTAVNLLVALDHRLQEGTFDPSSLAAYARLLGVGTVVLRSDLQYERFDTPRPRVLWATLTNPLAAGLGKPAGYGAPSPNRPSPSLPMLDEIELRTPTGAANPPPVALFAVAQPVPIVHAAPQSHPVLIAGDGEGIVDAVEAGLLDGNQLVLELAAVDDAQLRGALRAGADLVLTDSNRRRAETWFALLRDATGATERPGQRAIADDPNDYRLSIFPRGGDATRTVAEQRGGRVDATGYGAVDRYTAEDRPVHALDGDLATAWRVGGGGDPRGARLVITPRHPVRTDHVNLVQPVTGVRDRWLTRVRLTFDRGAPVTVQLGAQSRAPQGQRVEFGARTIRRLEIEPLATNTNPEGASNANPVGFAEVRLGGLHVTETVRAPIDLARRVGDAAAGHRVAVVLTRLRSEPGVRGRQDEELGLARRIVLPDRRSFDLAGTVRVDPNAPDDVIDSFLGTTGPGATYRSSGHLAGDADARASRAFDGDPATAWVAPFGAQEGQWVEVGLPGAQAFGHADLVVTADDHHSVPTRLTIEGDHGVTRSVSLPPVARGALGTTRTISVDFEPLTTSRVRFVVDTVDPRTTRDDRTGQLVTLPVAIADVHITGAPTPASPVAVPGGCRSDLLQVDGRSIAVRVRGASGSARAGLALESCGGALDLSAGSHRLQARPGLDTGLDVDRLVLTSDRHGAAAPVGPLGRPIAASGAKVRVVRSGPTSFDLSVRTDGRPFWLVLGQSHSDGWAAETAAGRSLGAPRLVDGYANGWLVDPQRAGTLRIHLRWTPQSIVWVGLGVSAIAVLVCAALVFATRRRPRAVELADTPVLASPFRSHGSAPSLGVVVVTAMVAGGGAAVVSRWWIGLLVGVATACALRVSSARAFLTIGSPLALAISKLAGAPELGWLVVTLLAADVLCAWSRERWGRGGGRALGGASP